MRKYTLVVLEEDEEEHILGRELWLADYVIVKRGDGATETIKDRFDTPNNKYHAKITVPWQRTDVYKGI